MDAAVTDEAELARMMIGETVIAPAVGPTEKADVDRLNRGAVLEVQELTLDENGQRILDQISFVVAASEIVGLAGVDGNGQTELVELLAGAREASAGRLIGGGETIGERGAMAVIPQNRDLDGLILDMTLWENLLLARPLRERMISRTWLNRARAIELCAELIGRFQIRAAGPETTATALSGGNRQRLVVARAVAGRPRVILAPNQFRGPPLPATPAGVRSVFGWPSSRGSSFLVPSGLHELFA